MKCHRLAGVAVLWLVIGTHPGAARVFGAPLDAADVANGDGAPLFRVFLKDGSSLVSYGELARVADRVVFSMPTAVAAENPELHLVDISSDRVDWERTGNYAESARAARYLRTRAESDYAHLTTDIAQALNDVGLTNDPARRLAIVQRARKALADWPPAHYNYKQEEVRQMLGMLDEAIADLRAATGAERFDLALVAVAESAKPVREALLPAPSVRETIEQMLTVAGLTESPEERTSLLSVALASLDRNAATLPGEWAGAMKAATTAAIARELSIDQAYKSLSAEILAMAAERARAADVRGVQRLFSRIENRDALLGGTRPGAVNALLAAVEAELGAAQRLRLERDRWALRLPDLRRYRSSMAGPLARLVRVQPALEDIKSLAGSGPDALAAILRAVAEIQETAAAVVPPDEFRELHSLFLSAVHLAESAAKLRREAAMTTDMDRAWSASSAAAGALMLGARSLSEMQAAFRLPQRPQ